MKKGINLLEKSILEDKETRIIQRRFNVLAVMILLSFAILNIFIFIYSQKRVREINEITSLIEREKEEVKLLEEKEIKYHILKEKLAFLSSLPQDKIDTVQIIDFLRNLENIGVSLELINIIPNKISFSANAVNPEALSAGLSLLVNSQEGQKLFKSVVLGGLSKGKGNNYRFDITLIPNI